MKSVICTVAVAMVFVLAVMPAAAATKVFLLGGQSNMAGSGHAADLVGSLSIYSGTQTAVKSWNGASWVALQPASVGFGPEVSFGYAIHNAFPNDDIYLVKYAVSGSMLADNNSNPGAGSGTWQPVPAPINPVAQRNYPPFKTTANAALASLAGKNPVVAGMLWMQGETDAYTDADALAYKINLKSFIATVRTDFHTPSMEFVIGQISDASNYNSGSGNGNRWVRENQAAVPSEVANTASFPTLDLPRWPNDGHYDSQGQIDLGLRFANVFIPEPSTSALLITGLFGLLCYAWRKRIGLAERTK